MISQENKMNTKLHLTTAQAHVRTILLQTLLFLMLLGFSNPSLQAQDDAGWKLKNKKENITIYTRDVPDSNLKELKMSSNAKTSLAGFVALITEIETNPDWINGNFSVKKLEQKGSERQYNRTTIDFPFPVSDRDLIGFASVSQNPNNKSVTIRSVAVPDAYPEQDGYVRIPMFLSRWELTPKDNGEVAINYFLRSDPGGRIPAWVTNMLLDVGPLRTFKAILKQLPEQRFQTAVVDGIAEPGSLVSPD